MLRDTNLENAAIGTPVIASAPVKSPLKTPRIISSVDDALLAPWAATEVLDLQDSRLFQAAMASDPALADDLAAARAERDAAVALVGSLGRPSARPLVALFEAIDAERLGCNVMRLRFDRPRAAPASIPVRQKIRSLR